MKALLYIVVLYFLVSSHEVNAKLARDANNLLVQPVFYANKQPLKINNAQQAALKVTSRYGGKVLKVQRKKVNGKPGYKVKLLKSNGQIVSLKVDAKSGKVSGN